MDKQRQWWIIYVVGYGDFSFYGTDEEAEEMRFHKARWEGGTGTMRPADRTKERDRKLIASSLNRFRWKRRNEIELDANELEAIRNE